MATVRVDIVMGPAPDEAVVRKVVLDDRGMVIRKYGLSQSGEWVQVAGDGSGLMDCVLDVRAYDTLAEVPRLEASLYPERLVCG